MGPIVDDGLFTWSRKPVYSFNKGINRWNEYNDPTYLGFVFMFDFISIDNNGIPASPLLNKSNTLGTTVNYLLRNNEKLRADYLIQFIECLESINKNMPWYWQSFEGGENLWKYNQFKEPYKGGDDSVLNIECLESIDLKITMLMDLYRKAIYDQEYKRIIVPENLRKFEMYIYVQEVRKIQIEKYVKSQNSIQTPVSQNIAGQNNGQLSDSQINTNENSPYILWRLRFCEFDPDVASAPFAALNMMHGDSQGFAKQKLSIKYELVEEPGNFYPVLNTTISSTAPNVPANNDIRPGQNNFEDAGKSADRSNLQRRFDTAKKQVTDKGKSMSEDYEARIRTAGDRYKENALSDARNIAQGRLAPILLGNVYGATNNVIRTLEQGSVLSLGPTIINSISTEKKPEQGPTNLDNVYG